MPTYATSSQFSRDMKNLPDEYREAFMACILEHFVPNVDAGTYPPHLRVKRVQGHPTAWEMTWSFTSPDGRAVFEYGEARLPGKRHVIWRRVRSDHNLFKNRQRIR